MRKITLFERGDTIFYKVSMPQKIKNAVEILQIKGDKKDMTTT